MPARFVDLDRQTPMFLPYDLREWVPADHIVHFILDAVEQLPITDFRVNDRGSGSEQYPPRMMLALLIYCYATGRFGSRTIEAASYSDVAVRYLCANHHPDHDSICTFRTANKQAFKAAFVSVLQLAQHLRLSKVGTVSIDGTKLRHQNDPIPGRAGRSRDLQDSCPPRLSRARLKPTRKLERLDPLSRIDTRCRPG
jgi:transposase